MLINSYYQLDCQVVTTGYASVASSHSDPWHQHLGHVNGVSKRMKRNLVESAHSMIAHAGFLNISWAKAISAASYERNRLPMSALKERETRYEWWYGRKLDVSHLRVVGCMAYAHLPECKWQKLATKPKKVCFVGYNLTSKGYHLFDDTNQKFYI